MNRARSGSKSPVCRIYAHGVCMVAHRGASEVPPHCAVNAPHSSSGLLLPCQGTCGSCSLPLDPGYSWCHPSDQSGSPGTHVSPAQITLTICDRVVLPELLNSGYSPTHTSAHLLRASGAMVLHLNNIGEYLIKNWVYGQAPLGSLTFMHKSPLSPQVCPSAWSSTMSSTMCIYKGDYVIGT
jgi:hypothetical protein